MNFQHDKKPLLLCLMVIAMLVVLSFMPPFSLGGFSFKKIDLLSSIRAEHTPGEEPQADADLDSVGKTGVEQARGTDAAEVDSLHVGGCPPHLTCIEDFSPEKQGLADFVQALSSLKKDRKGVVRIAFYGDSFIEGDIFCGSFRDTLQTLFGGRGVGFVPITSHLVGFRNTIRQDFGHWQTHSIIKKDSSDNIQLGPSGYCFKPELDNWVKFQASRQRYLRQFESIRLFYKNVGESYVHYTVNDTVYRVAELQKTSRLTEWKKENIQAKKVELTFENPDSVEVYGASFEGKSGVYVDNFAMRGNSGIGLHQIPTTILKSFNSYRDYKLIILQYGLNALNFDPSRYDWYSDRMVTVIERLKSVFPDASIVLLSVSDRSANVNGAYKTIRSIPALRDTQREIAKRTGIVFWDLYQAMGGENSMVSFVKAKPALAAKDYTHLTFQGGKKLSGELVGSLLYELEKYETNELHP